MNEESKRALGILKILSVDMINNAASGHPGIALSAAPIVYSLYTRHLKINPQDPNWVNRDRFILSAGHGSALLYAMLYLAGYKITLDDLVNFRKLGSITPGHPEYGKTPGVDMSTGPLGQGLAMSVGVALAERYIGAVIDESLAKQKIIDHYTYVLCSDGDLMEGVAYEAASFAGVQGLNKLIVLYDSNDVTLDAPLKNSFKDNILTRFESMGWNTDYVKEGNDLKEIDKAINRAKKSVNKPTVIEIKTVIGRGTYNEGKSVVHGKPLTKDDTDNLRRNLGITTAPFEIDKKVLDYVRQEIANRVQKPYQAWQEYYQKYRNLMDPDIQRNIAFLEKKDIIANFESQNFKIQDNYFEELRESNSKIINLISDRTKFFLGGSADLSSSCKTNLYKELDLTKQNPQGRNIYFGIREHAMGAIINGMALSGLHTYGSTFLSFADYLKPALRMAALMNLPVTYIFTHDTISVGQDGPTHQPIEQLTMLRTTPNLNVYRPADIREVIGCWDIIIKQQKPSALVISKDPLRIISGSDSEQTKQGAYVISPEEGTLQAVIIATGSELTMVNNVKSEIKANYPGLRLVSMPSLELFLKQDVTYQQTIIPPQSKVIVVEAGNPLIWCQFTALSNIIGLQDFGLSGRSEEVKQHFKIDYNSIKERIIGLLK